MSSQLSAIELLHLGDEGREKPLLNKFWPEFVGVPFGISLASFVNYQTKRPAFSGIQKHIMCVAVITGLLTLAQYKRDDYYAEKDAVYRHYIELHPEDFVEPERKKIADILEPWIPIR